VRGLGRHHPPPCRLLVLIEVQAWSLAHRKKGDALLSPPSRALSAAKQAEPESGDEDPSNQLVELVGS